MSAASERLERLVTYTPVTRLRKDIRAVLEERRALAEALTALRRVAFHSSHCPAFPPGCMDEPCTCGYDEADEDGRAALEKASAR